MTRFIDNNGKVAEIEMKVWNGSQYDPDWSMDCFNVGNLEYDEEQEAYKVEDIEYLIDWALDWKYGTGDFYGDEADPENNAVWVNSEYMER